MARDYPKQKTRSEVSRRVLQRAAGLVPGGTLHVGGEGWSPAGATAKAQRLIDFFAKSS